MCTEGAGVCGFLAVGEGGEFSRLLHKHLRPFDTHPTWPPETQSPQCYPCQVLTCQFWETKVELGSFLSIRGDPAGSLSGLAWLTPQGPRSKFSSGGANEECVKENFWGGGGRGGMLLDF